MTGRIALLIVLVSASAPVSAQRVRNPDWLMGQSGLAHQSVPHDHALLRAVYGLDAPGWDLLLGTIDHLAYPVMFGTLPAWWAIRAVEGDREYADAWRATLSWSATYAVTTAVKRLVQRERPFRTVEGIERRTRFPGGRIIDRYAFPSGHSSLSAALASSLALSHQAWYVVVPAVAWTVSVGLSRVWLGVHFPSDVVAGWAIGFAVAWTVHRLGDSITPAGLRPDPIAPPVRLVWTL